MPALSAMLLIFSFQFSLLFFHISLTRPHQHWSVLTGFNTQYRTSDVAKNLGRYPSCAEHTVHGKDFTLILTLKMETRYPADGQFCCEFPAVCNHCRVMTASSRRTWKLS